MKLTVIADLGHGKKFVTEMFVEENITPDARELSRLLQKELKYMSDNIVKEVVKELRPEEPEQIFARSLADIARRKGVE